MATVNLGRIKSVWKGDWAASTSYAKDDVVKYGVDAYICTTAHTSASSFSSDSANWQIMVQGAAQSGFTSMQVFDTAGNHTWTKPADVTKVKVYVTGGGGGAGGARINSNALGYHGGGGAAGGTAIKTIDVSNTVSVNLTVGAGGQGGTQDTTPTRGSTGGTSSFGSYCSATGGTGGARGGAANRDGGIGGLGIGGDLNLRGGSGDGSADDAGWMPVGVGGSSYWGGAGQQGHHNDAGGFDRGASKSPSGAGGSPETSWGGNTTVRITNGGGDGIIVVEEYR